MEGIFNYQMNGPTIEDVFLRLAEEGEEDASELLPSVRRKGRRGDFSTGIPLTSRSSSDTMADSEAPQLLKGKGSTSTRQAWILFRKRLRILSRNYLPYCAAVLVPILAAALVTLFLTGF